jgi:hypothetical protein
MRSQGTLSTTSLDNSPPSARRRIPFATRRWAWPPVVLLLMAAMGGVLLATASHPDVLLRHSVGIGVAAAGPPTVAPPASLLQDAVLAMVLPVSGSEARWTQGLDRFTSAVRYAALRDCVRSHQVPMPLVAPPMFIRFYDIPDLAYIRAHGFSDQVSDPEPHPPASVATAAVQNTCLETSRNAAQPLVATYAAVRLEWMREIASVQTDPDVAKADRTLPTCLARHHLHAADERTFFAVLADRSRRLAGRPQAAREMRELAADYATCMAPIETVRTAKRTQLRKTFLTDHPTDVQLLERTLPTKIKEIQRTTHIEVTFPA